MVPAWGVCNRDPGFSAYTHVIAVNTLRVADNNCVMYMYMVNMLQ